MKEKNKKFVVYKITNINTGKAYIGITGEYERRMRVHFNTNNNTYLHNAIQKHSEEKFKHKIICYCNSWSTLCKMEIEFIKLYNTKRPNGYNLTNGGEGVLGLKHSYESRRKMSIAGKGKITSDKTKQKMSIAGKGRKMSDESRKKMSAWQIGKKLSEKHKAKLSMVHQNISNETRKKLSESARDFSKDQILEIRKMLSEKIFQKDIAKQFNVSQPTISLIKSNKRYAEIQLSGEKL